MNVDDVYRHFHDNWLYRNGKFVYAQVPGVPVTCVVSKLQPWC